MIYTKQTYKIKDKKPYLFIGSKIRGLLGYALKEQVCINPSFTCKGCFAYKECIFYSMYEAQNVVHDYRLDFKLYNDEYKFSLLLFNTLIEHEKAIHTAMLHALKEYADITTKVKEKTFKQKSHSKIIKLEFLTPLRMKKNNKFALRKDDITLFDILHSIYKRGLELKDIKYQKLHIKQEYVIESNTLHYKELTRRSNKQNVKMNMGGLMGEMIISGVTQEVYNLVKLGEIIGVGKSTVFGLGKIKVKELG